MKDGVEYAAPLCTSENAKHLYVVYPSQNVSLGYSVGVAIGSRVMVLHRAISAGQTTATDYSTRQPLNKLGVNLVTTAKSAD